MTTYYNDSWCSSGNLLKITDHVFYYFWIKFRVWESCQSREVNPNQFCKFIVYWYAYFGVTLKINETANWFIGHSLWGYILWRQWIRAQKNLRLLTVARSGTTKMRYVNMPDSDILLCFTAIPKSNRVYIHKLMVFINVYETRPLASSLANKRRKQLIPELIHLNLLIVL